MTTIPSIVTQTYPSGARGLFHLVFIALTGCAQPGVSVQPAVYDFGPGDLRTAPLTHAARPTPQTLILVTEVDATPALDSTAVLYRLAYADVQQLKAYAQARWSMTPAQLIQQRLSDHLGQRHTLLQTGNGQQPLVTLHLALEEFSQLFETPQQSSGLLRLRATVTQTRPGGAQQVHQHSITVQRPAPGNDASGGVRALADATEAALQALDAWLKELAL